MLLIRTFKTWDITIKKIFYYVIPLVLGHASVDKSKTASPANNWLTQNSDILLACYN